MPWNAERECTEDELARQIDEIKRGAVIDIAQDGFCLDRLRAMLLPPLTARP
jgi:hypothetical protein